MVFQIHIVTAFQQCRRSFAYEKGEFCPPYGMIVIQLPSTIFVQGTQLRLRNYAPGMYSTIADNSPKSVSDI